MPPRYWLVKSEPEAFSIDDLARAPRQTTCWDGVRNYQARNYMRDQMQVDDRVLFYHSSTSPPAVVGTARVVRAAYPDHTAWEPRSDHFDPKASPENPIWMMVDIQLETVFARGVPIDELRAQPALEGMELLRRGSRLSVQPVTAAEFRTIVALAAAPASSPEVPPQAPTAARARRPARRTAAASTSARRSKSAVARLPKGSRQKPKSRRTR